MQQRTTKSYWVYIHLDVNLSNDLCYLPFEHLRPDRHLSSLFRYDVNNDHYLDLMEMKQMMEKLGAPQTHIGLKNMIAEIDEDSDGKVSFREVNSQPCSKGVSSSLSWSRKGKGKKRPWEWLVNSFIPILFHYAEGCQPCKTSGLGYRYCRNDGLREHSIFRRGVGQRNPY